MQGPGRDQSCKSGTNHHNIELLHPILHQPRCSAFSWIPLVVAGTKSISGAAGAVLARIGAVFALTLPTMRPSPTVCSLFAIRRITGHGGTVPSVLMCLACGLFMLGCSNQGPAPQSAQSAEATVAQEETTVAPAAGSEAEIGPKNQDLIDQAVAATDRSEDDRVLDAGRHPADMLRFFGVQPGMRVLELAVGKGYTAELLARVVGPEGRVYGQNNSFILQRFAEGPWSERLSKSVMAQVTRIDRELEAPVPPDVKDLDLAVLVLFYHDTVWFGTDRQAMNRAIYDAVKPGGFYGIIDHSARPGDGTSQAETLHRIEEDVVIREVEAAGFHLERRGDFLRNPADARDWNASPSKAGELRGTSDRFALLFRKPVTETASQATDPGAGPGAASGPSGSPAVACPARRTKACTRDYRPVCATVDTHIRCVRAPCPSTEQKTFPNACTACADENVVSYVTGACEE
jgi:predicted methyltransferase